MVLPLAPEPNHHLQGIEGLGFESFLHGVLDLFGRLAPNLDKFRPSLAVGDHSFFVETLDLVGVASMSLQNDLLVFRCLDIIQTDGQTGHSRVAESQFLELVKGILHLGTGIAVDRHFHQLADAHLDHRRVHVGEGVRKTPG